MAKRGRRIDRCSDLNFIEYHRHDFHIISFNQSIKKKKKYIF